MSAPATDHDQQWMDRMVSRFLLLSRSAQRTAPPGPVAAWRARVAELARAPGVARLVVGAAGAEEVEQRLAAGIAEAHAQAGDEGAHLVVDGMADLGAMLGDSRLLHGTGSWGLAGILRDGEVRAGGDGLTGEVAITDVDDRAIYVCRTLSLFNYYSAASFGYMNANLSGEDLRVSAVRAGRPWVADFFMAQFFGDGAPVIEEPQPGPPVRLVRHRTREMDESLLRAYDLALAKAEAGAFPAQPRSLARAVGVASDEASFANVIFAIFQRARGEDPGFEPVREAMCAAVLRHAPALRSRLLCPLPGDDEAALLRKERTLAALREQFPCVLLLDDEGVDVQEPSYFWTGECLVEGSIEARRILAVYVPQALRAEVRAQLDAAGLGRAEVRPIEHFEALRLVAESVPPP